ncbi:MAG TPA: TRAP transporter large permease [Desulfobacteraceae bacterium]|nr:TRAP transporter large permease [Desulfobacteraceae bacterium]
MSVTFIIIACVAVLLFLLITGCPIFICLGAAGAIGIFLNGGISGLSLLQTTVFGAVSKSTLVAAPLFMLMGEIIFRSGIGTNLYNALSRILHRLPGGLAIATVIASAIFGAMCGVSIAAVASIGVIALPEMLKRNYDPRLAAGAVCAPGALAMLIPPSLLFILYGEIAGVSVARLFTAGILPGILLVLLMCGYIIIYELRYSKKHVHEENPDPITWKETAEIIRGLWAPLLLIVGVLGSIYSGIATPTESAAIGVIGAYIIAAAIYRNFDWQTFRATLSHSARITATILIVFVGAVIFTQFLNLLRVPDAFAMFVTSLEMSPWITMLAVQIMLLTLGMFVDGASMILITTPILFPTMKALHWDPIWFGVLMVTNINIAVITPPVGLNLYTLASITRDVDMETILKGTMPYVIVEFIGLLILIAIPQISLWLPGLMR